MEGKVNESLKLIGSMIVAVVIVLVLYIFLHEAGHSIVILACGGRITDFSILTAHVSSVGGSYTDLADLWLHVNGALFPLLCAYVYMLFYRKQITNHIYRIFSWFVALLPIGSALAWVFIPLLFINGNAPVGDDCTNFLENFATRHNPIWVTCSALALMGLGIALMIKKRIIADYVELMKKMKGIQKN